MPPSPPSRDDIAALFERHSSRYATVAFVDLQGQLRGKTVNAEKLLSGFPDGVPFSPLNMMLDYGDHTLFPRGYLTPDLDVADNPCDIDWQHPRTLPFEDEASALFFFAQFADDTQGAGWDPRRLYEQVGQRAAAMDLSPVYGLEYEYRLLDENPQTLRDKRFTAISLVSDVSTYGGVMHQSVWSEFFKDMRNMCDEMSVKVASMHWEVAAAMGEVALQHQAGVSALDDAVLFKTHAKVLAKHHNLTMTFMARPLADDDGQSGHVHVSLVNGAGDNVFHDASAEHGMSTTQRHFIGGLQKHLPEILLMMAPNINSFKRFVPGIFAPTRADWGIENRTTAIRVLPGTPKSQRLELRIPGSDSNPYLVAAALLAAGLHGISEGIDPAPAVSGASHLNKKAPASQKLPTGFADAIQRFEKSAFAREQFGDDFVQMFAGTRRAQLEEFAKMVTDKELERFLEHA